MTPGDQTRKEDETPAAATPPSDDKTPPNTPKDPKKPAGGYIFKFAPADPKNSFDFEDTADK